MCYHRLVSPAVAILAILGLIVLAGTVSSLATPGIKQRDFTAFWLLLAELHHGLDPSLPLPEIAAAIGWEPRQAGFPWQSPHPPTAGILLSPLYFLGYEIAGLVWLGVSFTLLVATVALLGRIVGRHLRPLHALAIAAALVTWDPVRADLGTGQVMSALLLLLTASAYAMQRQRPIVAGALVGISLLVKPVALPVAALFLVKRQRWALVSCIVVGTLGWLAVAVFIGPARLAGYGPALLSTTELLRGQVHNLAVCSVGWRLFSGTTWRFDWENEVIAGPLIVASSTLATVVSYGLWAATLAAGYLLTRRLPIDRSIGLAASASVLLAPVAWSHYLVLCLIAIAQTGDRLWSRSGLIAVAILLIPHPIWIGLALSGAPSWLGFAPTVGVMLLIAIAYQEGMAINSIQPSNHPWDNRTVARARKSCPSGV